MLKLPKPEKRGKGGGGGGGSSTFLCSEPSLNLLAALAPFSREMKELSGEALWQVKLEKRSHDNPLY